RSGPASIARSPPAPARKPTRSAWLPLRRRKFGAAPSADCICASTPPRNPPPPIAVASARRWRCWCPRPARSCRRSNPRRPPTRPPSKGCAPWPTTAPNACHSDELRQLLPLLRAQPNHVLLDENLFPGHESPPALLRRERDSELAVKSNDDNH